MKLLNAQALPEFSWRLSCQPFKHLIKVLPTADSNVSRYINNWYIGVL